MKKLQKCLGLFGVTVVVAAVLYVQYSLIAISFYVKYHEVSVDCPVIKEITTKAAWNENSYSFDDRRVIVVVCDYSKTNGAKLRDGDVKKNSGFYVTHHYKNGKFVPDTFKSFDDEANDYSSVTVGGRFECIAAWQEHKAPYGFLPRFNGDLHFKDCRYYSHNAINASRRHWNL